MPVSLSWKISILQLSSSLSSLAINAKSLLSLEEELSKLNANIAINEAIIKQKEEKRPHSAGRDEQTLFERCIWQRKPQIMWRRHHRLITNHKQIHLFIHWCPRMAIIHNINHNISHSTHCTVRYRSQRIGSLSILAICAIIMMYRCQNILIFKIIFLCILEIFVIICCCCRCVHSSFCIQFI